jgi:hypothetical protein
MSDEFTRPPQDDAENVAPQKLLENFTQNKVVKYVVIAVIAHVVIIVGTTSPRTLYEMVNPAAKKVRLEKERSEERAVLDAKIKRNEAAKTGAKSDSKTGAKDGEGDHDRKDTAAYKELSESEEAPEQPDDLDDEGLFED